MADHIDKQIRTAATTALTGLTTTGSRVYPTRAYPMQDENVPGLRIYVPGSAIEVVGISAPALQERDVELVVEFCDKVTANYDNTADASKKEVEVAIANNNTLGGVAKRVTLTSIESEEEGEGEKVLMLTRLTFAVRVYTEANAPDVPL